jgi:hypothetical protein
MLGFKIIFKTYANVFKGVGANYSLFLIYGGFIVFIFLVKLIGYLFLVIIFLNSSLALTSRVSLSVSLVIL